MSHTNKPEGGNHLTAEQSPYLLQHAHQPVDWYPWCEEAFARARAEDKPVFLSIGYSTCHWCHVMAHESFDDPEVARALNQDYVSIKVDREERPDLDTVYMSFCQAMTGQGGWPLTLFLTPEGTPFFAATYLPKTAKYGQSGLLDLLEIVRDQWRDNQENLLSQGRQVTAYLQRAGRASEGQPSSELTEQAVADYARSFDARQGGFGGAPKFPMAHSLIFLLRQHTLTGDRRALDMASLTLTQMARGGIYDQLGGGFARYSTDAQWLAPHFEKMLYDNALLLWAYAEGWAATGQDYFRRIAQETADYVLREMRHPEGSFYTAQDADAQGVEGRYYLLNPLEVQEVLGTAEGKAFCAAYDITAPGNFEGASIPNLLGSPDYATAGQRFASQRAALLAYRAGRMELHRDDKVLTSWSSLMAAALARAGRLLDRPDYIQSAQACCAFIDRELRGPDGRLLVRWRGGHAAHAGLLDDYAFFALAHLELYDATLAPAHLRRAAALCDQAETLFSDHLNSGYFLSPEDGERLLYRPKETYDGALPSGNSALCEVQVRLAQLTGAPQREAVAERQLRFVCGAAHGRPTGSAFGLLALQRMVYPAGRLVCALPGEEALEPVLQALRPVYRPALCAVAQWPEGGGQPPLDLAGDYPVLDGRATFYLCRNRACQPPTHDLASALKLR